MKNYDLVTNECCGSGQVSPHSSIQTVTKSLMVMMLSSEMCECSIILTGGRVTQLREIEIQIVPN